MSALVPMFKVTKTNGTWVVENPEALAKYKQDCPDETYFLSIGPKKKQSRTLQQNKYYYGVLVKLLSEHQGCSPDDAHMIFSKQFLPVKVVEFDGQEISYFKSTKKLCVEEFSGFITLCIQLLAELEVIVPDIDEVLLN